MESRTRSNMNFTTLLSENKNVCYKACMATYQIGHCIKAGVHLVEGSIGIGSLPFFQTDQIVPSIPIKLMSVSNNFLNHKISF